jgi:glucokinase
MLLGIEIGGTKLQVVTGNGSDQLLSTHRFAVKKEEGAAGIRKMIEETVKEYYANKITAVGLGFGGPINRFMGR